MHLLFFFLSLLPLINLGNTAANIQVGTHIHTHTHPHRRTPRLIWPLPHTMSSSVVAHLGAMYVMYVNVKKKVQLSIYPFFEVDAIS